jgi:hypothetical protein
VRIHKKHRPLGELLVTYRATLMYIAVVVTVLLLLQIREMGWLQ